ncbi:hypothetical protein AGDE_04372 [Angomonas deanei]|uniref:Uncharacterized protein n=1 Tax=Angomonas deanei TaxID=59799 RepID=A0A7G2CNK5_9TRYP|nr:hypothetical protein AGDE_04372 [Angomonas deanei]CAD2221438.1 hypothetical protein, conserved [Angomonas deanei]|eukprot:EPY39556.1 hypothetical protein AGDE_04372 [Angomonas deanei]
MSTFSPSELEALQFVNDHLRDRKTVHVLVVQSMQPCHQGVRSTLLDDDVQRYLLGVLELLHGKLALRKKLVRSESLYFLDSLTRKEFRDDFVTLAATPMFAA